MINEDEDLMPYDHDEEQEMLAAERDDDYDPPKSRRFIQRGKRLDKVTPGAA